MDICVACTEKRKFSLNVTKNGFFNPSNTHWNCTICGKSNYGLLSKCLVCNRARTNYR